MLRISELAEKVGVSRSTLLYYEKLGLLQGARQTNGYRFYTDKDVQHLVLLQQLQAGGLTLQECKACLTQKIDRSALEKRLHLLDKDIAQKQHARTLLAALLGKGSMKSWHQRSDQLAPEAHQNWLKQQGFNEKQALRLKWLSKDMNEHDQYMADFMLVFEALERWGPGTDEDSLKALSTLPSAPKNIIDIGCGKGFSTSLLAKHTSAQIVAVDNEQTAIDELKKRLSQQKLNSQVTLSCSSMAALPFEEASFDLVWAEGSAYIMGVEQALKQWKLLLKSNGFMVVSDIVWLTDSPSNEAVQFWKDEYPDMQTVGKRLEQIQQEGFEVLDHFTLSQQAWLNYYKPLKDRITELKPSMKESEALSDLEREISIYEQYLTEFSYQMFVLQQVL